MSDPCNTVERKTSEPFPEQALAFENTVGKGEIARNEQFLLFPQCFLPFLDNFPPFQSNSE